MAKKTIVVEGSEITLLSYSDSEEYISLSDIMKRFEDEFAVYGWMRNRNTVEFLGVWEQLHNPSFNSDEFVRIKSTAGANSFNLTPKKWVEATGAIGMTSKTGRYGSGIFAHKDIAVNFCYCLSTVLDQRVSTVEGSRGRTVEDGIGVEFEAYIGKGELQGSHRCRKTSPDTTQNCKHQTRRVGVRERSRSQIQQSNATGG
ncbi:MAG: KilA-N domain-containing protein [Saprospiraceae bacterium]